MADATKPRPPSAILFVVAAIMLMFIGAYFVFARPPLLPEDIRYMGLSQAQVDDLRLPLSTWLTQVFRVMGGYIFATGVLGATLAVTAFREHRVGAGIGALIGGIASIGWMSIVNFMINSDYKWALFCVALVWALGMILFWSERRSRDVTSGTAARAGR